MSTATVETAKPAAEGFVYPPEAVLRAKVIWYMDPSRGAPLAGEIIKCKNRSCDIITYDAHRGIIARHDCRHVDDPRVLEQKAEICTQERGIFEMDRSELRRQRIDAALPQLFKRVKALEDRLQIDANACKEEDVAAVVAPAVSRRGAAAGEKKRD